jgi:hypothetical protein
LQARITEASFDHSNSIVQLIGIELNQKKKLQLLMLKTYYMKVILTCFKASGSDLGIFSFTGSFDGFFLTTSLLAVVLTGFAFALVTGLTGRPKASCFALARN